MIITKNHYVHWVSHQEVLAEYIIQTIHSGISPSVTFGKSCRDSIVKREVHYSGKV